MKTTFYLFLCSLLFIACSDTDQLAVDKALIEDYLTENGLEADVTPEGVYYIIDEPGSSEMPTQSDEVTVKYRGYYLDDFVFEAPVDPIEFLLGGVIAGWRIGIPLFGKGGKGTLIIPSDLAYGSNPPAGIRKDAVLVFDIELLDF